MHLNNLCAYKTTQMVFSLFSETQPTYAKQYFKEFYTDVSVIAGYGEVPFELKNPQLDFALNCAQPISTFNDLVFSLNPNIYASAMKVLGGGNHVDS